METLFEFAEADALQQRIRYCPYDFGYEVFVADSWVGSIEIYDESGFPSVRFRERKGAVIADDDWAVLADDCDRLREEGHWSPPPRRVMLQAMAGNPHSPHMRCGKNQ